ncbi:MAG: single-stranded-DNA-specific exonuclease RecJ [Anaerolineae bacterium]|nr:single-stranded-DNA-specific exonuclease RecJ [Anaerolineae bacterium]
MKRWRDVTQSRDQHPACLPDLPPLLAQVLCGRGITDPSAASDFLASRVTIDDPFLLEGMNRAVPRLHQAIYRGQKIAVYGDFDADGVTATAVLVRVLSSLGARVEPYIPDRVDEGYGLNLGALRKLYRRGVRLVVTVDCGVRSITEAEQVDRHMNLIITDHHLPGDRLPPATAIIDPKQPGCAYPFKDLAGVGLAYKLAQALLARPPAGPQPAPDIEESLLDLVAIGTVADLAPLLGENRSLVRRGLDALNEASRPGVAALIADAGLRKGEVDSTAIGFRLGPRLNAAGRLEHAMIAYDLLTKTDALETRNLAERLGELNRRRQQLTDETVAAAEAQVLAEDPGARLYLAASPDFKPGIVGLAASRLTEAYYRPSVVVEVGEEESRGSCRSIPEFHITEALDECRELLIRHGGHRVAAGFTVATANLPVLRERLQAIAAERLAGVELKPTLEINAEVPLEEVGWPTYQLLSQLEPCGAENPTPVLLSRDVEVREIKVMGAEQKHLKLVLRDRRGAAWDAVLFRGGHLCDEVPGRVDVAYCLLANKWNGEDRLQLEVQDLRASL